MDKEQIFLLYKKIEALRESMYITMPEKIGFNFDQIIVRESNEVRVAGGAEIKIVLPSQSYLVTNKPTNAESVCRMGSGNVVDYNGVKMITTSLIGDRFGFSSLCLDKGEQGVIEISIPKAVTDPVVDILVIGYKRGEF